MDGLGPADKADGAQAETPLIVACLRRLDQGGVVDIDAAIAATHLMLAAAALGVGTTWVMHFIPEAVREEFALPDRLEPTALLVMGYPAASIRAGWLERPR